MKSIKRVTGKRERTRAKMNLSKIKILKVRDKQTFTRKKHTDKIKHVTSKMCKEISISPLP